MAIAYDFKLTADQDLYIDPVTMDFAIVPSDKQHVSDILQSAPGWYKEFSLVGFNPYMRINASNNKQELNKDAKTQLAADGYRVGIVDLEVSQNGEVILKTLDISRD